MDRANRCRREKCAGSHGSAPTRSRCTRAHPASRSSSRESRRPLGGAPNGARHSSRRLFRRLAGKTIILHRVAVVHVRWAVMLVESRHATLRPAVLPMKKSTRLTQWLVANLCFLIFTAVAASLRGGDPRVLYVI